MKKGVKRLIVVILCLMIIFGCGLGVLSTLKAIALQKKYFGTPSAEVFKEGDDVLLSLDDDEIKSRYVVINKTPGKDFKILNITDTHLSDYDYRLVTGDLAIRDIKRLVKEVKPDLITLSGDLVCAKSEIKSVKKLTETMNSFKIPWAPVFGNHDGEAENIDKDYLAEVMMGKAGDPNNYCMMRKGPNNLGKDKDDDRVGNYVINIVEGDKLIHSVFMMDSGRDQVTEAGVAWYKQNMKAIQKAYKTTNIDTTLVLHIPLAQYYYAYMEGYKDNQWIGEYKKNHAYGNCYEDVCCDKKKFSSLKEMRESKEYKALPKEYQKEEYKNYLLKNGVPIENGLFAALKENGGIKNVLCGHDHLNCFFAPYQGVNLIYSLKNGMGSGYKVGRNGGTILTVKEDGTSLQHYYL